jgi:hypothetical protein
MVRVTVLLLAVAAAALCAAGARATARAAVVIGDWQPVGGAGGWLLADGERYVVTRARDGVVRVRDTATGERRRITPPPCDSGSALPGAVGSGVLVWECGSPLGAGTHLLVVDDLRSGQRLRPAGLEQLQALEAPSHDGARFHVDSVGRNWIYLTRSGYHYADDVLVGLGRAQILYRPAERADVAVDPDRPRGTRRLCDGIRRSAGYVELGELPFGVVHYHRPYAITDSGRVRRCAGAATGPSGRSVIALSDTYLGWATGRLLALRPTNATHTARRHAPATVRSIALTRRFVYVTTGSGARTRAYRARLRSR